MLLSQFSVAFLFTDYVFPILLFILGLGLVVFVHELGHFIAAKGVGIKVEQFAFGFGKRLFGIKWGETDYRINLLPLGGYVKMMGQEDFKALTENDKPDPRSYEAKSVGARFLVISAGVIMNIILAAVLFVTVGLVGREFQSPMIGGAVPGSPAFAATITWEDAPATQPAPAALTTTPATKPATSTAPATAPTTAPVAAVPPAYNPWINRLQSGDRIMAMEGDSFVLGFSDGITNLADVKMVAALAKPTDRFTFIVERTVNGVTRRGRAEIGVFDNGGMLAFGLAEASSMKVGELAGGSASMAPFQPKDEVIAVAGKSVATQGEVERIEQTLNGQPVPVVVKRDGKEETITVTPTLVRSRNVVFRKDGTPVYFQGAARKDDKIEYQLPGGQTVTLGEDDMDREQLRILGMAPRSRVLLVTERSNAEKAGIKPGDILVSYGDRYLPTFSSLMEINKAHAGHAVTMEVLRDGKSLTLEVKPKQREEGVQIGLMTAPDLDTAVVADVLPGSAAAKAGISRGSTIQSINGKPVKNWVQVYQALADAQGQPAEIGYTTRANASQTAKIDALTPAAFHARHYEFSLYPPSVMFTPLTVTIRQDNIGEALVWGGKETVKLTLTSYASLRSLVAGSASVKHMTGPIGIGALAVKAGQHGIVEFIYFLAFISSAIAVFNFLPLPVLDGGHALFLIIEKVRGKPVPVKVLNYAQYIGMFLLLGVFLAVTYQDIARLLSGWIW